MIGSRLSHYEITQHIGSGGMGDVYQAADSKLGRNVAIKFLPAAFAHDADYIARFQREARVLASLNHANIAAIHGIEEVDKHHFLVLELVQGETLQERIRRGPIPLEETLDIAKQIAAALEAAHDSGIVHRDLKPANVKITPEGNVKVLDFGLAKALAAEDKVDSSLSMSPTMSLTAHRGMIIGTAGYMAPEQARGRVVDRRADIWAFGVVLYEMVTGQKLFKGEDVTDTIAAVVRETPDLSAVPPNLRRLLERCLEKDPKKRLPHIAAFPLLLEPVAVAATPVGPAKARSSWLPWGIAAVVTLALAAVAAMHFREVLPEEEAVQFLLEAPPETRFINQFGGFGISHDGRQVVFSAVANGQTGGTNQLWLRSLDQLVARPIPGTENGNFPAWSPDNKSIVFAAAGKLKRVEIAGGSPLTLSDLGAETLVSATATWSTEGVILHGSSSGLMRVPSSGGGSTLLTKVDTKLETGHGYPQFLPDGERFLYFVASGDANIQGVYASSLAAPTQRQQILRTGSKAVLVPGKGGPDYLLWMQDTTLLAQRFNVKELRVEGDPASVAEDVGLNPNMNVRAAFWAAESGALVYLASPTSRKRPLVWKTADGPETEAAEPDTFRRVAIAPGGDRIAVSKTDLQVKTGLDVWIKELARGVMTRLTFDPGPDDNPIWSPDGKQITFAAGRNGSVAQVFRKDASGSGEEERLTDDPYAKAPLDWSRDGKYILYRHLHPDTGRDLLILPLADRKPIIVANTKYTEGTGAISPDGQWIAYASNESGVFQVYVKAFPGVAGGPAGQWQVSTKGGYDVRWRDDGKELYYESLDGDVMAASIQTSSSGVRVESARELFSADFQSTSLQEFDVTPDGKRFIMIINPKNETSQDRLTVVTNWKAALRK